MPLYKIIIINILLTIPAISKDKKYVSEIEFINVPSGEFTIDNSYYYKFNKGVKCPVTDEKCRIPIKISGFSISKFPITRFQWEKIYGNIKFSPWEIKELPTCPDCYASSFQYDEISELIKILSKTDTGKSDSYRLPTESEMIYLFSSCSEKVELVSSSSQIYFKLSKPYSNKFNFSIKTANLPIYFWTEDNAQSNYLEDILNDSNIDKSQISNPIPKPSGRFNYGKMLLNYSIDETGSFFRINRLGHSKNMIPDEKEIIILIVKKDK